MNVVSVCVQIVNDMFEFGVSVENLFEPDDLLQAKDIPKVRVLYNVVLYH